MKLFPIQLETTDLPDAWFQALYSVLRWGRSFKIDEGSYAGQTRLELDYVTINIAYPWLRDSEGLPLIPEIPPSMDIPAPVTKDYLREYVSYLMTSEKKEDEQYTYGQRLCAATVPNSLHTPLNIEALIASGKVRHFGGTQIDSAYDINVIWFNQIEFMIDKYKSAGHRNNQMVLQIAQPSDLLLSDPPCLRHIDTRIQDNKLHFFPYFRSWSMWGGFPANLAAISLLQEYMAGQIGVDQGEMIVSSKGLHLYGFEESIAKMRCQYSSE
jgi:thymidylate synthase